MRRYADRDRCQKTGKVCHKAYYDAVRHVRRLMKNRDDDTAETLEAFRCGHCQMWHVGHKKKPKTNQLHYKPTVDYR